MRTSLDIHPGQLQAPVTEHDHVLGTPGAPVTMVEYGDYECPYCAAAHPVVVDVLRMRMPVLLFAYRHFPLSNVHPRAEVAAEAAEAAGAHGRYWAMHDWLFEHQAGLQPAYIMTAAEDMGLDVATFAEALRARTHFPRVQQDFMTGLRSGVNGTPTFFINGVRHDGAASLADLLTAVDAELG